MDWIDVLQTELGGGSRLAPVLSGRIVIPHIQIGLGYPKTLDGCQKANLVLATEFELVFQRQRARRHFVKHNAEGNLGATTFNDKDIGWLDGAMDDAIGVNGIGSVRNLDSNERISSVSLGRQRCDTSFVHVDRVGGPGTFEASVLSWFG